MYRHIYREGEKYTYLGLTARINEHDTKCKNPHFISLPMVVFLSLILNNRSTIRTGRLTPNSSNVRSEDTRRFHQISFDTGITYKLSLITYHLALVQILVLVNYHIE